MKVKKTPTNYDRKAVYTGRRLQGNKVYQRFELLPERTEMFFSGIKGAWIGYIYKCTDSKMSSKPERTDDDRMDNAEWDAADALVDAYNAKKRAEAAIRGKQSPALKAAIVALKPLMRGLSSFSRAALIAYLAEETRNLK